MIKEIFKNAKFELGSLLMTRGVSELVNNNPKFSKFVWDSIKRHAEGDWGVLSVDDKEANDEALVIQDRILSAYEFEGKKIWIITEWNRSATTVLFPSEY